MAATSAAMTVFRCFLIMAWLDRATTESTGVLAA
jgi:hypothetical protein